MLCKYMFLEQHRKKDGSKCQKLHWSTIAGDAKQPLWASCFILLIIDILSNIPPSQDDRKDFQL